MDTEDHYEAEAVDTACQNVQHMGAARNASNQ